MKTITFFSEKGGVGKSTMSILYASWLSYKHGVKVAVADFNNRIQNVRDKDMKAMKAADGNPDVKLTPAFTGTPWPTVTCKPKDVAMIRKNNLPYPHFKWLDWQFSRGDLRGFDVIVCDFPGSLTGQEFTDCLLAGGLSLIVIPVEKEQMTIASTFNIIRMLEMTRMDDRYCAFINRALLDLTARKKSYMNFGPSLKDAGVKILPDFVQFSDRLQTLDRVDVLRSTLRYPDFDSPDYAGARTKDLGIENLFIDVTRELAKRPDLPGTDEAVLDFVDSLKKKDDGRQFAGSAFPHYEL